MALTLHLTPEIEARLSDYAHLTGKSIETVIGDLLQTLPSVLPLQHRVAGLGAGNILHMTENFDDPLPDNFWDAPLFPEQTRADERQ